MAERDFSEKFGRLQAEVHGLKEQWRDQQTAQMQYQVSVERMQEESNRKLGEISRTLNDVIEKFYDRSRLVEEKMDSRLKAIEMVLPSVVKIMEEVASAKTRIVWTVILAAGAIIFSRLLPFV